MPQLQPFAGWRFDPGKADYALVTMPPSEEVDEATRDALYRRNDRNAVRLIMGRPFSSDTEYDNADSRAAAHLDAWRAEGLFIQDRPAVYVCQQDFTRGGQPAACRGFFARMLLAAPENGGAFPHAALREDSVARHLARIRATRANLEPVVGLLTDPSGDISRTLYGMCQYPPVADFADAAGTRQRFWVLDAPEQAPAFCQGCSQEQVIIAAGHQRYAAAIRYRDAVREALRQAGQPVPEYGELAEDYVMAYVVPDGDPGLELRPLHRLLCGATSTEGLAARLEANFIAEKAPTPEKLLAALAAAEGPAFGLATREGLSLARLRDPGALAQRAPGAPAEWQSADAVALHRLVLDDLPGMDAADRLRYAADAGEAIDAVKSGKDNVGCAFILRAPTLAQVRGAARGGALFPARTIRLHPQPPAGLAFNFFW